MTAGRGDFSVSSKGTGLSNFFCMVHRYTSKADYKLKGVAECVVKDIPLKPPILATIKSNNYLINALTCEAAEDQVCLYERVYCSRERENRKGGCQVSFYLFMAGNII